MKQTSTNLGRLEKVELRDVWAKEDGDFTPWLGTAENIALLGDAIGLDLEVEAQEKEVGAFRADILCKDTANDTWVLIENQLEKTDHTHLGQLMTYAAGLDAVSIVWIAARMTDEHRAALNWLNDVTTEDINFFGLEVELWRIDESRTAPRFNIVSKPNDWTSGITRATRGLVDGELSSTKQLQLKYWTEFWRVLESRYPHIRGTRARPQHWNNFSIGRSTFVLVASVNTQKRFVWVYLMCKGANALANFKLLRQQKNEIETEVRCPLEWRNCPATNRLASPCPSKMSK